MDYDTSSLFIHSWGDSRQGHFWINQENSDVTTQWNLSVNGVDQGDFIVESLEEFKQFFKLW